MCNIRNASIVTVGELGLSRFFIADIGSGRGSLNCEDVGNVAQVSEIHAVIVFRVGVFLLYFMSGES
jgi:hypothetical protein